MTEEQKITLVKKDYLLITFIGVAFALFALPILKNLAIASISVNFTTAIALVLFFGIMANIALLLASLIAIAIIILILSHFYTFL